MQIIPPSTDAEHEAILAWYERNRDADIFTLDAETKLPLTAEYFLPGRVVYSPCVRLELCDY